MSFIKQLKDFLTKDENSFLEKNDNFGKIIMISGVWGSGKTFFWKNEVVNSLKKPNIYISMYGKDSIDSIQQELLMKVINLNKKTNNETDVISKTYSVFSFLGRSLCAFGINGKQFFENIDTINKKNKNNKAIKALSTNNIIICFDDFERKSIKIDLHDLFGFISQLALEFKCLIVIILNEDLFKGNDAEIFSRVKEKTVNKYIEFKPTIDDLFTLIFNSNQKYKQVEKFKDTILSSIKEINELNGRTYFQILDNCLEYYIKNKEIENKHIRTLCIATSIFTNYNLVFNPIENKQQISDILKGNLTTNFSEKIVKIFHQELSKPENEIIENKEQLFEVIKEGFSNRSAIKSTGKGMASVPGEILKPDMDFLIENMNSLWFIYLYYFKINFRKDITNDELIEINDFIK